MTEACAVCPARVIGDATRLLAGGFGEIVPPEAQLHLINAQRELLLAVALIVEHNSSRTVRSPRAKKRTSSSASTRRPKRVRLD